MLKLLGRLMGRTAPAQAPIAPPAPAPEPGQAAPDPAGLPDFLARLRIGDRSVLTRAHLEAAAGRLGLPGPVLRAVVYVECGGQAGFIEGGLPHITFEPHVFSRLTRGGYDADHPDVSYSAMDQRKYPRNQDIRWRQLAQAYTLNADAALQATSWGVFQILGLNYAKCGFSSAAAFVAYLAASEARQLETFEIFLIRNELVRFLRQRKWKEFAKLYNGPSYAEPYGRKMANAYKAMIKAR